MGVALAAGAGAAAAPLGLAPKLTYRKQNMIIIHGHDSMCMCCVDVNDGIPCDHVYHDK